SQDTQSFFIKPYLGFSNSSQFGETIKSFDKQKCRKAFTIGVMTENTLDEKFSFVSGIQYQQMGSTLIDNPIDPPLYEGIYDKEKFDYLSVPLLIKYKFGVNQKWNVQAGFVLSRLLSATSNGQDISHVINYNQVGASLGFGYVIKINDRMSFSIDQQNSVGLIKNTANNQGTLGYYKSNTYKIYNFYSCLNFGIQIGL